MAGQVALAATVETDPVTAYHELLEDDVLCEESLGQLQGGQLGANLFFGRHPLCSSLRPNLLSPATYARATAAAEAIGGAMATLEAALLADPDLRRELDMEPAEEELAVADARTSSACVSSRLDGFLTDELRFVEYNAEQPAGMAYGDNLTRVFDTLPVMREFAKRYRLIPLQQRDAQFGAMMRAFREWGGAGPAGVPVVAIVDWAGLPTQTEFELFREYFARRGVRAHIVTPEQVDYRSGTLYADGHAVNLVFKRLLTSELLDRGGAAYSVLRRGYLDGAYCSVNPFRAKLLDKKMSMALLLDDRYAGLYSTAQRAAIARHVPWTRKVRHGPTTRHGNVIPDLIGHLCAHRRQLVLKPNDEYGGKGVVLGWTVDGHEWDQAVAAATAQSYVVQEAVPVPKETFPVVFGADVRRLDLSVDTNPYLFYGQAHGCLTRVSSSALLNVTAGSGSLVPTYLIEGPLR